MVNFENKPPEGTPDLPAECAVEIQEIFKDYIFYKSVGGGKECWCTHCNQHFVHPAVAREMDAQYYDFLAARHNDRTICPQCGAEVTAKEYGRGRQRLNEDHNIAIIVPAGKYVYVRCFHAEKIYQYPTYSSFPERKYDTPGISCWESKVYRFRKGTAQQQEIYYGVWNEPTVKITEPFWKGTFMAGYETYVLTGIERLRGTFMQYCSISQWQQICQQNHRSDTKLIKYMAEYAKNPPAVEMMIKRGYGALLVQKIIDRQANQKLINWDAAAPQDLFRGISAQDLRTYIDGGYRTIVITAFIKWHASLPAVKIADVAAAAEIADDKDLYSIATQCARRKISAQRWVNCINRQLGNYEGGISPREVCRDWRDYLHEAKELHMDLKSEVVFMPKNLPDAHAAASQVLNAQRDIVEKKNTAALTAKNRANFGFEDDEYIIIIPETIREIVEEGKRQEHCVGSYADRHFAGKLVIAFLRKKSKPLANFYTVEIDPQSYTIRQCRGKRNASMPPAVKKFTEKYTAELALRKAAAEEEKKKNAKKPKKQGRKAG